MVTEGEDEADRPRPPGAAYLVTGPGEQPLPGLAEAAEVTVTVPSKQSRAAVVSWTARVSRVAPGSAEWAAVIGPLLAGRLNAASGPGQTSTEERWARTCAVFRLQPHTTPAAAHNSRTELATASCGVHREG